VTPRGLVRTTDAGRSWRSFPVDDVPDRPSPGAFFVAGSSAWLIRQRGSSVVVTHAPPRDGTTTSRVSVSTARSLASSVAFIDSRRGWLSIGPTVYRTADGGRSWTLVTRDSPVRGPLHFVDAQVGWSLGHEVARTDDGGKTWTAQHPPAPFDPALPVAFEALSFFGSSGVLEVTVPTGMMAGLVFDVTSDGGRTWTMRDASGVGFSNTGPHPAFAAISASDWRLALESSVWSTADGGRTWSSLTTVAWDGFVQDMSFASDRAGWAVVGGKECGAPCPSARLYTTSDGGRTWRPVRVTA